jgi:HD-like signal output (HDOD) protein
MPPNFINELKKNIESSIPTSSIIVGEVIKTVYDRKSNAADLAKVIERDPPLTANILKIANSAYYGTGSSINSIRRGVVILGFETIKELALNASVVHYFYNLDNTGIDLPGLWIHSVGTAKAAQLISTQYGVERNEVMYTVGLLHDLGKILLAVTFPDHYKKVVELAQEKKCRLILAEQRILNTDHCMIGKIICDIWALPEDISAAIFFHHDPMLTPKGSQMMARIISLGDFMCRKAKIGNPGDETVTQPSSAVMSVFGNTPDKVKERFNSTYEDFVKMKPEIEDFFTKIEENSSANT